MDTAHNRNIKNLSMGDKFLTNKSFKHFKCNLKDFATCIKISNFKSFAFYLSFATQQNNNQ